MSGEKRSLPRFDGGVKLVKASTWNAVMDFIERTRVRAGENVSVTVTTTGTIISGKAGGSSECNFGTTFQDGGSLKIRGGVVTGGENNIVVDDTAISSGTAPADGTQVWLRVTFESESSDDVLLPGGNALTASIHTGSSLPDNDIPTATSPNGVLYIGLGSFEDGKFHPSGGCGNFQITHCPGSLIALRY